MFAVMNPSNPDSAVLTCASSTSGRRPMSGRAGATGAPYAPAVDGPSAPSVPIPMALAMTR